MGAGGGRRFRAGAPVVLVLLMIAAAALPRRALAVTDAADGNVPPAFLRSARVPRGG